MKNNKELVDSILADFEKEALGRFNSDIIMVEAVRKVLLAPMYYQGSLKSGVAANPSLNFALALAANPNIPNETLGQDLRAVAEGIRNVETAFDTIKDYKKTENKPGENSVNPGR